MQYSGINISKVRFGLVLFLHSAAEIPVQYSVPLNQTEANRGEEP